MQPKNFKAKGPLIQQYRGHDLTDKITKIKSLYDIRYRTLLVRENFPKNTTRKELQPASPRHQCPISQPSIRQTLSNSLDCQSKQSILTDKSVIIFVLLYISVIFRMANISPAKIDFFCRWKLVSAANLILIDRSQPYCDNQPVGCLGHGP